MLQSVREEGDKAQLANRTKDVIYYLEEEILLQRGLLGKSGYEGSSGGPKVRWTSAAPRKEGLAAVPFGELCWRKLADQVVEWRHLLLKARERAKEADCKGAASLRKHAKGVWIHMAVFKPAAKSDRAGWDVDWRKWRLDRRRLVFDDDGLVASVVAWLRGRAANAEAMACRKRLAEWIRWAKAAVDEEGGRKAFRWIKEAPSCG